MLPIITIAKEKGSKGKTIAELVSQKLNIPLVDDFFTEEIGEKNKLYSYNQEKDSELLTASDLFANTNFYSGMIFRDGDGDKQYIKEQIVLDAAKNGPCIIIGRSSHKILEKAGIQTLDVLLYTNSESLNNKDKKKSANYDLAINSSVFGIETTAELIIEAAKKFEQ